MKTGYPILALTCFLALNPAALAGEGWAELRRGEGWAELRRMDESLERLARQSAALFCSESARRAEAPAFVESFRRRTGIHDAVQTRFEADGTFPKFLLVLDAPSAMLRIAWKHYSSRKISIHDVSRRYGWKELDLTLTDDCEAKIIYYREQGHGEFSWVAGAPMAARKRRPQVHWTPAHSHSSDRVAIAVLDTGVDARHPEFDSNLLWNHKGRLLHVDADLFLRGVEDYNDHGTHVAGIATRRDPSIAVIPVRMPRMNFLEIGPIAYAWPEPSVVEEKAIQDFQHVTFGAVHRAVDLGARIVNMSFGLEECRMAKCVAPGSMEGYMRAIRRFRKTLFVIAAGNEGKNLDRMPLWRPNAREASNALMVASTDFGGGLSEFSNYGRRSVDLAAPGEEIVSAVPLEWKEVDFRKEEKSGTSMAAPIVSYAAAKMLEVNPTLTPEEIRAILCRTVDRTPELAAKTRCGGVMNILNAIRAAKDVRQVVNGRS